MRRSLSDSGDLTAYVVLEDDGVGFDPALAEYGGALGLDGMHERAEAIGGHLTGESWPGVGTTIIAQVPIKHAAWSGG